MTSLERPRRPYEAMQIMSHLRFFPGSVESLTGGESLRHYRNKWNTSWLSHLADFVDAFLYYSALVEIVVVLLSECITIGVNRMQLFERPISSGLCAEAHVVQERFRLWQLFGKPANRRWEPESA
jgi:hypothetical protein